MKVIFLKAVPPHVAGDIVEVAPGYAHNFLLPKKLARLATPEAVAAASRLVAQQVQAVQHADQQLQAALQALQGTTVTLHVEAAPSGRLYAALTPARIASELEKQTAVRLPETLATQLPSIKQAGEHAVTLQYHGQTATFTLKV